ncbi:MAG: hypothetical protein EBR82_07990 [Caulobacteraceae bacterium]|nr:hypothetical protein [Caulobacteraceae bacterium]
MILRLARIPALLSRPRHARFRAHVETLGLSAQPLHRLAGVGALIACGLCARDGAILVEGLPHRRGLHLRRSMVRRPAPLLRLRQRAPRRHVLPRQRAH